MADLVAWSPIKAGQAGTEDKPGEVKMIMPGDSVSQSDLGLDDEQWAQLQGSSAVRTLDYPDMPDTFQGSPVEFLREQARLAAEGAINEANASEENMQAIMIANQASSGTPEPEPLDPEVQAEMDKQLGAEGGSSSTTKASSSSSGSSSSGASS